MNNVKKASRRNERALAFQVLYSLTFSPVASRTELIKAFAAAPEQANKAQEEPLDDTASNIPDEGPSGFAWELVEGVWEKGKELNDLLARYSQNWRVERMGKVEVTILRLALYELMFRMDVPPKVAINEAIDLSKQFGDHGSRAFVNGILDAAAKALDSGELQRGQ